MVEFYLSVTLLGARVLRSETKSTCASGRLQLRVGSQRELSSPITPGMALSANVVNTGGVKWQPAERFVFGLRESQLQSVDQTFSEQLTALYKKHAPERASSSNVESVLASVARSGIEGGAEVAVKRFIRRQEQLYKARDMARKAMSSTKKGQENEEDARKNSEGKIELL
jgi:hypothetical protein